MKCIIFNLKNKKYEEDIFDDCWVYFLILIELISKTGRQCSAVDLGICTIKQYTV